MSAYNEVFTAAATLPPGDRLRLIDALWDSVPPEQLPPPSEEWIAESQRRSAAYDAGETTASSWVDVCKRTRKKANLDG